MAARIDPATGLLINEPSGTQAATLVLAHGAGGTMDSQPLTFFGEYLAAKHIRVVRFEFPYMRLRRTEGRRRGPDSPEVLLQTWRDVIAHLGGGAQLVIGGKSMGGRIASMVADEMEVRGLVCLGYPFHPPGKPQQLRISHLKALKTPTLVLQGERDPFGGPEEVSGYLLSKEIRIHWIPDGDHSFKPRKQSGHTETGNLNEAGTEIVSFISRLK
jgi:predicted alpha/beta-hydrolase family hydrolase